MCKLGLCAGGEAPWEMRRDALVSRCGRVSVRAGDAWEGRAQYSTCVRARACVSVCLAGSRPVSQSVSLRICPAMAPRGKMSMAGHDPSLGRIDSGGCTWSPPLLRYCG